MSPFVALGLSAASLVFNIIGLAIPYWQYADVAGVKAYSGLWSICGSGGGESACITIPSEALTDAFKATRAMEILGMLVILAALVCVVLNQFVMKDMGALPKVGGCCAIVAGIFMIIGTVIFATMDGVDTSLLHAGFALCIIAGVIGIVAGVVMFLVSKE